MNIDMKYSTHKSFPSNKLYRQILKVLEVREIVIEFRRDIRISGD